MSDTSAAVSAPSWLASSRRHGARWPLDSNTSPPVGSAALTRPSQFASPSGAVATLGLGVGVTVGVADAGRGVRVGVPVALGVGVGTEVVDVVGVGDAVMLALGEGLGIDAVGVSVAAVVWLDVADGLGETLTVGVSVAVEFVVGGALVGCGVEVGVPSPATVS